MYIDHVLSVLFIYVFLSLVIVLLSVVDVIACTGCGKKSGPLKSFAVFSATVSNFNLKFYTFIYKNLLHLNAK